MHSLALASDIHRDWIHAGAISLCGLLAAVITCTTGTAQLIPPRSANQDSHLHNTLDQQDILSYLTALRNSKCKYFIATTKAQFDGEQPPNSEWAGYLQSLDALLDPSRFDALEASSVLGALGTAEALLQLDPGCPGVRVFRTEYHVTYSPSTITQVPLGKTSDVVPLVAHHHGLALTYRPAMLIATVSRVEESFQLWDTPAILQPMALSINGTSSWMQKEWHQLNKSDEGVTFRLSSPAPNGGAYMYRTRSLVDPSPLKIHAQLPSAHVMQVSFYSFGPITDEPDQRWFREVVTALRSPSQRYIVHHRLSDVQFDVGENDFRIEITPGTILADMRTTEPTYYDSEAKWPDEINALVRFTDG